MYILIAMSKIFERSMSDQMGTYFEDIFSKFLAAFRRKYGCQSTLVRMCKEWRLSLDKGESVGSIAMDLSRAFDSVPHGLLIAKFHAYGASTTACKLPVSYSTTICKLVDLIPALRQSDCRIPNWVSAKTVLSCSTNHGQTTARFRSFFR